MAILAFQKPEKVIMLEADEQFGKFEFRPLEPGFGITIGNSLRRILLSSLEGYAINSVRIDGVDHEFASIPGVLDDMTNIILNLKQIRFKQIIEDTDFEKVSLAVSGLQELKAGDLGKAFTAFEVLNPDLKICSMEKSVSFNMELTVNKGRSYVPAEEQELGDVDMNLVDIKSNLNLITGLSI